MSAPATRSSGRLCREGDENAELELRAGSRGARELPRLQSDADRILQQPTDADRKRALPDSVRKWLNGTSFEQCWIGKVSGQSGGWGWRVRALAASRFRPRH